MEFKMRRFSTRVIRKISHISNKQLSRAEKLTKRIENKTTKILEGTDFSVRSLGATSFEKLYYSSLPHITPLNPALPAIGAKPTVTLLIPTLDGSSFYGGTATALFVAARMAHLTNRRLRIIQTLKTGSVDNLSAFLNENLDIKLSEKDITVISVADRAHNIYGYVSMLPNDIFIASAWWDAYLLNQLPLENKYIYLVQDFEPIFYNNSDNYILSEMTYKNDKFIPLCNTSLMSDFMKNRFYNESFSKGALFFEPAVSRLKSGSLINKKPGEKRRLFIYGRPEVHRNLFFTALNSVDYAFKSLMLDKDEWELCMAGQDGVPDINLSCGLTIKNMGKMSMADYTNFSKTIDLALSLMMAPHPNYPTLEFASIGSAVVTTKYSNKQNLSNYSKNIIASDISIESIAGALYKASEMKFEERMKNIQNNNISDDWSKSLDFTLNKITEMLNV